MNKKVLFFILIVFSVTAAFAGGQQDAASVDMQNANESIKVRVVTPTGLPAISLAHMIEGSELQVPGYDVDYQVLESPDLLAGKLISGEADMAIVPTNLAIKLYNKGVKVKYAGAVVWGILYIVSQEDLNSWDDLKGKELYMLGRGLTPDIVTRYLLTKNGLDPDKDVKLTYVANTTELAPSFITGKSKFSIMPEPALSMVTKKRPSSHIMLDLQKEWAKTSPTGTSYPQASLIVIGDFAENNPDFVEAFCDAYNRGIEAIKANPAEAGKLASAYLKMPPAPVIAKSIPRGNLQWVPAVEAKAALEQYFQVFYDFQPGAIGGKMPDENFYLKK